MAITGPIPLPENGMQAFDRSMLNSQSMINSMMQNRLNPYQIELLKAKAKAQQGAGAQSQMIANLIGTAFPNAGQPNAPVNPDTTNAQPVNAPLSGQQSSPISQQPQPNRINGGAPSQPMNSQQRAAKNILQALGVIKETPEEQEDRENRTNYTKAVGEMHAKKLGELEDAAQAGIESEPTYQAAEQVIANPGWKNMRDFAPAPNLQLKYYKINGTPEQKAMIAHFQSNANQFILDSIKKFPQRFTNKDLNFMKSMKVSDDDSFEAGQAKVESAHAYERIMSQRAAKAADIALKQQIPPYKALELADKQMNVDQIRDQIHERITGKKNTAPVAPENPTAQAKNAPPGATMTPKGFVVLYKNGKEYHVPPKLMHQALQVPGVSINPEGD